jgi:uncharacterized protein
MRIGVYFAVMLLAVLIGACSTSAKRETPDSTAVSGRIPVPQLTGRVVDAANLLLPADRERLANLSSVYEQETGHQIAVVIVPTLAGEAIEGFCLRTANTWRLGRRGIDDGVIICLAPNERKVRIELGTGINRYISNEDAKEIIDTKMMPYFKVRNFAEGLERGLKKLMEEGRRLVAMDTRIAARGPDSLLALRSVYAV